MAASIHLAEEAVEIARCFPVMRQLRPALVETEFAGRIAAQRAEGYRLAICEESDVICCVAGFRVQTMLVSGRTLYVDDLVTDAGRRSEGHGAAMLRWLIGYAKEAGCETFSLDSGTQRQEAHAFYLRERLRITSFHFALKL